MKLETERSRSVYHGPMFEPRHAVNNLLIALATLLPGMIATAQTAKPVDAFYPHFNEVLTRHGIVGGGFAFVHGPARATQFFFGQARNQTGPAIDADTAYNWASITKT